MIPNWQVIIIWSSPPWTNQAHFHSPDGSIFTPKNMIELISWRVWYLPFGKKVSIFVFAKLCHTCNMANTKVDFFFHAAKLKQNLKIGILHWTCTIIGLLKVANSQNHFPLYVKHDWWPISFGKKMLPAFAPSAQTTFFVKTWHQLDV